MEPITLRTERLLLRPFEERDEAALAAACDDPDIQRFVPVPEPYTLKDAEEFVRGVSANGWREDTMYNFGVFTRGAPGDGADKGGDGGADGGRAADGGGPGGELVGSMGLVRLSLHTAERQAELGFWTARGHRRKGYTAEAARAVADWAFSALGVERLEWLAQVENTGSRAVAQRLGFVEEGIARARIVHRGTRRDARVAALLPSDLGHPQPTPYLPSPPRG
ncbi:acetyltransferase [Streptomyces qinglanensis]|uniref:Acetyltransferase n=1 Tax=Streptomyces qinglanensis TaxID=943816 RepID=A0A1E7K0N6_9ACTN|nr:GNAT family protein [Streptomyces qinglanensis]OEU97507.1 acetyltransferase [Streptomyces qinglanensis]OEV24917.1 acetyltransferase [Streptomyces nanshensis]